MNWVSMDQLQQNTYKIICKWIKEKGEKIREKWCELDALQLERLSISIRNHEV